MMSSSNGHRARIVPMIEFIPAISEIRMYTGEICLIVANRRTDNRMDAKMLPAKYYPNTL